MISSDRCCCFGFFQTHLLSLYPSSFSLLLGSMSSLLHQSQGQARLARKPLMMFFSFSLSPSFLEQWDCAQQVTDTDLLENRAKLEASFLPFGTAQVLREGRGQAQMMFLGHECERKLQMWLVRIIKAYQCNQSPDAISHTFILQKRKNSNLVKDNRSSHML